MAREFDIEKILPIAIIGIILVAVMFGVVSETYGLDTTIDVIIWFFPVLFVLGTLKKLIPGRKD